MDISDLTPNPRNPRKRLGDARLDQLRAALREFGDLSGIVHNRRTGELVGGHQRTRAWGAGAVIVEQVFDPPTRTGTVALGHVEVDGERHRYREVDWPRARQDTATIAANAPAGEWDDHALAGLLADLGDDIDLDLTMLDAQEREVLAHLLPDHAPPAPSAKGDPGIPPSGRRQEREVLDGEFDHLTTTCPRCRFTFAPAGPPRR